MHSLLQKPFARRISMDNSVVEILRTQILAGFQRSVDFVLRKTLLSEGKNVSMVNM